MPAPTCLDINAATKLGEGRLDLIDPRRMIEAEQPIYLFAMPAEPARQFGASDACITQVRP
jgi:hypothetical protein